MDDMNVSSIAPSFESNASGHWQVCKVGSCDVATDMETHIFGRWAVTKAVACLEIGIKERFCMVCCYKETGIIPITDHTSSDWESEETNHWNIFSGCNDKQNVANHDFKWGFDKEATGTETNLKHEECEVCGYEKAAVEIPAIGTPKFTGSTNPAGPEKPADSENLTNDPIKPGDSKYPTTSDNNMIGLCIVLLLVSGGVVAGTTVYSRKRKSEE